MELIIMSTTTIRLSNELKARIESAAKKMNISVHQYMVQAVTEKTKQMELYNSFNEEAEERYANIVETGKAISWSDMRSSLENYVINKKYLKPTAKKLTM